MIKPGDRVSLKHGRAEMEGIVLKTWTGDRDVVKAEIEVEREGKAPLVLTRNVVFLTKTEENLP